MARECKKFNKALLKVISSKPTGVNESDMVNMAAAVHLGKTDVAAYRHKDFPAATWKFYRAWLVLKDHPMFAPPKPKKPIVLEDFSDDDDDDEEEGGTPSGISESEDTSTITAAAAAAAATPVALWKHEESASSGKQRGPGPGRDRSKKAAKEAEYKKRKMDALDNIVHNSNAFGHYCGCVAGSTKATLSNEGVFSFLVMSTENTEVLL